MYQGEGKPYPRYDTLSVGDTIAVVYDKTDPDNNIPERNYEVGYGSIVKAVWGMILMAIALYFFYIKK